MSDVHPNTVRVIAAAREAGLEITTRRFPEGTKTAADAAAAIGVCVGEIVKSLVFAVDGEILNLHLPACCIESPTFKQNIDTIGYMSFLIQSHQGPEVNYSDFPSHDHDGDPKWQLDRKTSERKKDR